MFERQQDAMSYFRQFGKADLIITMTTNPKWIEITNNLVQGQKHMIDQISLFKSSGLNYKRLMNLLKLGCLGEFKLGCTLLSFRKVLTF